MANELPHLKKFSANVRSPNHKIQKQSCDQNLTIKLRTPMPPNIPNIAYPVSSEMGQEPTESHQVPEHISWNPRSAAGPIRQEVENRNNYHHHHSQWVIQTYGVQEPAFPPQRFFNNPSYPSYLLEIGQTFYRK